MDRPEDPNGVVEASAPAPSIDWNEAQFEPADPDHFDAFMAAHRKWMLRVFEHQFGEPVKLGR